MSSAEPVWPGLSCASILWPHTADPYEFETRRAISSLLQVQPLNEEAAEFRDPDPSMYDIDRQPSGSELLGYVEAAAGIAAAAERVLVEVAQEAFARGAQWAEIGARLGIKKSGAQKRFGKTLDHETNWRLGAERTVIQMIVSQWACPDDERDQTLFSDDDDLDPMEVLQHGQRRAELAVLQLAAAQAAVRSGRTDEGIRLLETCSNTLDEAMKTMLNPKTAEAIRDCIDLADKYQKNTQLRIIAEPDFWTYSLRVQFLGTLAAVHLTEALDALFSGEGEVQRHLISASAHLGHLIKCRSRPDQLDLQKSMNTLLQERGLFFALEEGEQREQSQTLVDRYSPPPDDQ